jgi:ribokinase
MQAGQSATAYHRRGPIFRWALLVSNGKPRAAMKRFDVLGLGCAAVDDVLYVPSFPRADEKVRVARALRRCGGLTGAAMVTAARMGATCAFAGCLGTDESSQYVADYFVAEGIDVSHAPRLAEARVVTSTIVVGQDIGSRNIFYLSDGLIGAHEHLPPDEVIRNTRVLFIDQYGMKGNLRAARIAHSVGASVVADFEDGSDPGFREVLGLVDHLILSKDFARRTTRTPDPAQAAQALWQPGRAAVIITDGPKGCWSLSDSGELTVRHHPAFLVAAKDTTGCGDVFHGAYAACLARGDCLEDRIRFASAAAALRAKEGEIPRLVAVEQFLANS